MFGRQPRLPVDLAFGLPIKDKMDVTHSQYVKNLKSNLKESFRIAVENSKKMAGKNKARYDRHVVASVLEKGDRVLVRNVRLRGKNKLADKWEEMVYVVIDQHGDLPVYKVCPEFQTGPIRTLHRDLLLPCGTLSSDVKEHESPSPVPKRKTRSRAVCEDSENIPDSDEEVYYLGPQLDVVHESYTLHTSEVTHPERNTVKFLKACSENESPNGEVQPEENLPGDPEENLHGDPEENLPGDPEGNLPLSLEVEPERENTVQLTHSATLVSSESSVHRESPIDRSGSAGEESNNVKVAETCTGVQKPEEIIDGNELRRSTRIREKPKVLTYPKLGNPLITIVQSLLQGLNDAFSESLQEHSQLSCPVSQEYVLTKDVQRDLQDFNPQGSKNAGTRFDVFSPYHSRINLKYSIINNQTLTCLTSFETLKVPL
ncbi:uncharacterized protein [Misgurnus anguillicaudatus]|uniref:uncharacterized protein n=1 Tax=Misgurnus anguillicaudatus TaxID=75329 RepID=UPI003CCF401B